MIDKKTLETTNQLAKEYNKRYSSPDIVLKERMKFASMLSGTRILDVGCGHGRDSSEFAKLGYTVTGIDVSVEMLKFAKEKSDNVTYWKIDMCEIMFPPNAFNGIWCCSSLYHIKKTYVMDVLKKFHLILKDHGILFITIKRGKGEGYQTRDIFHNKEKFYALYSVKEIYDLVTEVGFKVMDVELDNKDQKWINVYCRK